MTRTQVHALGAAAAGVLAGGAGCFAWLQDPWVAPLAGLFLMWVLILVWLAGEDATSAGAGR